MRKLKFIDLYAGLGGFHQALSSLGHKGVWASEYNLNLRELYKKNFEGTPIEGDIFKVNLKDIPDHDVICGGFPCQPFSRAGYMKGFEDESKGNHFFRILDIIDFKKKKKPTYIFLENVETLLKHDKKRTYSIIKSELEKRGYEIDEKILSPHEFNIPHHRRRLFIVGKLISKKGLSKFNFPEKKDLSKTTIDSILSPRVVPMNGENVYLSKESKLVFDLWAKFVANFPTDKELPGFPIWSHEWGATYPFEKTTPASMSFSELKKYKGAYGRKINVFSINEAFDKCLPRYAKGEKFPEWKVIYLRKNRNFYRENKEYIDAFLKENPSFYDFEFSWQKLEWSCHGASRTFDDKIIQFRPSGVRIKLSNWSPALTTVRTQNIYIPKIGRKLCLAEIARLQSMKLKHLPDIYDGNFIPNGGYKAFGNAVNVELVRLIAKNLLNNGKKN